MTWAQCPMSKVTACAVHALRCRSQTLFWIGRPVVKGHRVILQPAHISCQHPLLDICTISICSSCSHRMMRLSVYNCLNVKSFFFITVQPFIVIIELLRIHCLRVNTTVHAYKKIMYNWKRNTFFVKYSDNFDWWLCFIALERATLSVIVKQFELGVLPSVIPSFCDFVFTSLFIFFYICYAQLD